MKTPLTYDDIAAWLGSLPPAERIAACRLFADRATVGALSALADATVYEATRVAKAAEVAEQLGLSPRQVQRAVASHNQRQTAAS